MPEFTRVTVTPVIVERVCEHCHQGNLVAYGKIDFSGDQPKFTHKCDNQTCGHEASFGSRYPKIDYIKTPDAVTIHWPDYVEREG
jgi:hypothetical protein